MIFSMATKCSALFFNFQNPGAPSPPLRLHSEH
jgi:hypothetical protein